MKLKLVTCQMGLKRLHEGKSFSAFEIENDELLTKHDVVIEVHMSDAIERSIKGLYTVSNTKTIIVLDNRGATYE